MSVRISPTRPSAQTILTGADVVGGGADEVHEAGPAVELGEEHGGVGLGVGRLDPLEAGAYVAGVAAALAEHAAAVAAHPHGGSKGRKF